MEREAGGAMFQGGGEDEVDAVACGTENRV